MTDARFLLAVMVVAFGVGVFVGAWALLEFQAWYRRREEQKAADLLARLTADMISAGHDVKSARIEFIR